MKRTQVAREVRDELYAAEAAIEAALKGSQSLLDRMLLAREELGLTGSVGDAAIASVKGSIETAERAQAELRRGHVELDQVMKSLDIRGVAIGAKPWLAQADDDTRAA